MQALGNKTTRFIRKEAGGITVLSIFFFFASLVAGSLAVDFMKKLEARTDLQVVADSVAHAALYNRLTLEAEPAILAAMQLAEQNLSASSTVRAIEATDIEFGIWDPRTRVFMPDPTAEAGVRVTASRNKGRANIVGSVLANMLGIDGFEMSVSSVFELRPETCDRAGLFAEHHIKLSSNNLFTEDFCIHSNQTISMANGSVFQPNTHVSLPNLAGLSADLLSNSGLDLAVHESPVKTLPFQIIDEAIKTMVPGLDPAFSPSTVVDPTPVTLDVDTNKLLTSAHFIPGRKHVGWCSTAEGISFEPGVYSDIVFVTNCLIDFKNGASVENATIVVLNPDEKSVKSSQGFQLGRNDNCADGGDTLLVTTGGLHVAAGLQMYGARILARGQISFAAREGGMQGVSMISNTVIEGTSNSTFGFCDDYPTDPLASLAMVQ